MLLIGSNCFLDRKRTKDSIESPLMNLTDLLQERVAEKTMKELFPDLGPICNVIMQIELAWVMADEERDKHDKSSLEYKRLDEMNLGLLRLGMGGANPSVTPTDLSNRIEALESHYTELLERVRDDKDIDPPTEVELLAVISTQSLVGPSAAYGSHLQGFVNTYEYLLRRNMPSAKLDFKYSHPNGFTEDEMWHINHTLKEMRNNFKWVNGTRKKTLSL